MLWNSYLYYTCMLRDLGFDLGQIDCNLSIIIRDVPTHYPKKKKILLTVDKSLTEK